MMALAEAFIDKVRDTSLSDNSFSEEENFHMGRVTIRITLTLVMSAVAGFAASQLAVDNPPSHAAAQWRSEGLAGPPTFSLRSPLNTIDSYAVLSSGCDQATCATTITLTSIASDGSEAAPDASAIGAPGPSAAELASAIRAERKHHPTGTVILLLSQRELQGSEIVTMAKMSRLPVIHITRTAREHSCLPVVFNICPGYSEYFQESFYTHGSLANGNQQRSWWTDQPACWQGTTALTSTADNFCRWFDTPATGRTGVMYAKNDFTVTALFKGFPFTAHHWQQFNDTADGGAYYYQG
jgi:hypothetical protein